ncbi:hypothetical protein [Planctomicrobium sp. SH527]|uniref:hypothetical protein n=1 Tax=Planctomicrobium sp. SH527 TaxID=3448123 RepID=UPI003F5C88C3
MNTVGCTSVREYVGNGFKVGPNHRRPAAPVADDWIDSQNSKISSESTSLQSWRQVFQDPILDNLIQTSYQQNLTLREAGFRVAEAQAQRGVVAGQLFPQSQELLGDFKRLLTVQQLLLSQQESLAGARGNAARSLVDLYRALGGGWEIRLDISRC